MKKRCLWSFWEIDIYYSLKQLVCMATPYFWQVIIIFEGVVGQTRMPYNYLNTPKTCFQKNFNFSKTFSIFSRGPGQINPITVLIIYTYNVYSNNISSKVIIMWLSIAKCKRNSNFLLDSTFLNNDRVNISIHTGS